MQRYRKLLIALAVIAVFWAIVRSKQAHPTPFEKAVSQYVELTTPANATTTKPAVTRKPFRGIAEWSIETRMSLAEYQDWLADQVGSDYETISKDDSEITLQRTVLGDTIQIQITRDSKGNSLRVRLTVIPG